MTYGLALNENLDALQAVLASDAPEQAGRGASAISVLYGPQHKISTRDLDPIEEHRWPIAGPNAYPMAMRLNPGDAVRTLLAWELQLLVAWL